MGIEDLWTFQDMFQEKNRISLKQHIQLHKQKQVEAKCCGEA